MQFVCARCKKPASNTERSTKENQGPKACGECWDWAWKQVQTTMEPIRIQMTYPQSNDPNAPRQVNLLLEKATWGETIAEVSLGGDAFIALHSHQMIKVMPTQLEGTHNAVKQLLGLNPPEAKDDKAALLEELLSAIKVAEDDRRAHGRFAWLSAHSDTVALAAQRLYEV